MTTIEDLVRDAQARQADRAVPPARILATLPVRAARVQRQRRIGWATGAVAAAAVAGVIAVPALAVHPGRPVVLTPATVPAPSPSASAPAVTAFPVFRLGYKLTWAPSGMTERIRSADTGQSDAAFGPTVMRIWKKQVGAGDPSGGAEFSLYVRTAVPKPADAMDTSGQKVDIHGARGYYQPSSGDHKSSVDWSPDPHTVLMITAGHLDVSRSDMLKAARSVAPDPGTVDPAVRLDWLPDGWSATGFSVSGPSAARWRSEVFAGAPASPTADPKSLKEDGLPSLSVVVGTTTDAPAGGPALLVGGHPARWPLRTDPAGQSLSYLVVDLGHGRLMTLIGSGGIQKNEMMRVAAATVLVPAAAGWIQN